MKLDLHKSVVGSALCAAKCLQVWVRARARVLMTCAGGSMAARTAASCRRRVRQWSAAQTRPERWRRPTSCPPRRPLFSAAMCPRSPDASIWCDPRVRSSSPANATRWELMSCSGAGGQNSTQTNSSKSELWINAQYLHHFRHGALVEVVLQRRRHKVTLKHFVFVFLQWL